MKNVIIRINYIRPFMIPQEGRDILELNLDYVSKIADDILQTRRI